MSLAVGLMILGLVIVIGWGMFMLGRLTVIPADDGLPVLDLAHPAFLDDEPELEPVDLSEDDDATVAWLHDLHPEQEHVGSRTDQFNAITTGMTPLEREVLLCWDSRVREERAWEQLKWECGVEAA